MAKPESIWPKTKFKFVFAGRVVFIIEDQIFSHLVRYFLHPFTAAVSVQVDLEGKGLAGVVDPFEVVAISTGDAFTDHVHRRSNRHSKLGAFHAIIGARNAVIDEIWI